MAMKHIDETGGTTVSTKLQYKYKKHIHLPWSIQKTGNYKTYLAFFKDLLTLLIVCLLFHYKLCPHWVCHSMPTTKSVENTKFETCCYLETSRVKKTGHTIYPRTVTQVCSKEHEQVTC